MEYTHARGPVLFTMSYMGKKLDLSTISKIFAKPLTTAVAVHYTGLTVRRGIKRYEVTNNETYNKRQTRTIKRHSNGYCMPKRYVRACKSGTALQIKSHSGIDKK